MTTQSPRKSDLTQQSLPSREFINPAEQVQLSSCLKINVFHDLPFPSSFHPYLSFVTNYLEKKNSDNIQSVLCFIEKIRLVKLILPIKTLFPSGGCQIGTPLIIKNLNRILRRGWPCLGSTDFYFFMISSNFSFMKFFLGVKFKNYSKYLNFT